MAIIIALSIECKDQAYCINYITSYKFDSSIAGYRAPSSAGGSGWSVDTVPLVCHLREVSQSLLPHESGKRKSSFPSAGFHVK